MVFRALLSTLLIALSARATATDRVALLIENRDYGQYSLAAGQQALQKQLTSKGFAVEVRRDLDSKGIEQTLTEFLRRAPTNGTVVLAFSGHGVSQVSGQRRRWIGWQGVGAAKDERSAERACYKCDRLESLITKESGGRRHFLIMDFAEENPMLKEAVVPDQDQLEDALGNGELQVYREWRGALSAIPFSLNTSSGGFRDYAHLYKLDSGTLGLLLGNTTAVAQRLTAFKVEKGKVVRDGWSAPNEYLKLLDPANDAPSEELMRSPTEEERDRLLSFLREGMAKNGKLLDRPHLFSRQNGEIWAPDWEEEGKREKGCSQSR